MSPAGAAKFIELGMKPFRPYPGKTLRTYYEVPAEVLAPIEHYYAQDLHQPGRFPHLLGVGSLAPSFTLPDAHVEGDRVGEDARRALTTVHGDPSPGSRGTPRPRPARAG